MKDGTHVFILVYRNRPFLQHNLYMMQPTGSTVWPNIQPKTSSRINGNGFKPSSKL
jgi:hypothetical protein